MNCSVIDYYFNSFFSITFRAKIKLVFFYLAKKTWPYFPDPSYFIFSKSERNIFLSFFLPQEPPGWKVEAGSFCWGI